MKYAVYVEGKAELLFVADILAKYSNYNSTNVGFACINLNADHWEYVQYPAQGSAISSSTFYQIVNVNNDGRVISKLRKDIPNLIKQGFKIILGLRDVFGEDYKSLSDSQEINMAIIEEMHSVQSAQLRVVDGADVRLHYAIMEYETWMMALMRNYVISRGRNFNDLLEKAGVDSESDFEKTIFHPYNKVKEMYKLLGKDYGKHESDYQSFLSTVSVEDYEKTQELWQMLILQGLRRKLGTSLTKNVRFPQSS